MANYSINPKHDDLHAAYAALVAYHNEIVKLRFTVAGLFLAANGFLVNAFFQSDMSRCEKVVLSILGVLVAKVCYILEIRNYQLLLNVGERGIELENSLELKKHKGFFSLMEKQPINAILLPFPCSLTKKISECKLFSHSYGICFLYFIFLYFGLLVFSYSPRNVQMQI